MRFKLHQEETLPEHQKKFSHKKKIYGMPDQLHDVFKSTRLKIWHTVIWYIKYMLCLGYVRKVYT